MAFLVPKVDSPLSLVASGTAVTSKGTVNKALDSKDAIYLVDGLFKDSQLLIGELRVLEEHLTVPSH